MPKKANLPPLEQRLAPKRIAEALASGKDQMRADRFLKSLDLLKSYLGTLTSLIGRARDEGVIDNNEKLVLVRDVQGKIASPIAALEGLRRVIWLEDDERFLKRIACLESVPEEAFIRGRNARGKPCPKLSPTQRGERLRQAVDRCLDTTNGPEPEGDPFQTIVFRLARSYLNEILVELARLRIVCVCEYCHHAYFPANRTKRYCSLQYDGRNCAGNARARRHYQRSSR